MKEKAAIHVLDLAFRTEDVPPLSSSLKTHVSRFC